MIDEASVQFRLTAKGCNQKVMSLFLCKNGGEQNLSGHSNDIQLLRIQHRSYLVSSCAFRGASGDKPGANHETVRSRQHR